MEPVLMKFSAFSAEHSQSSSYEELSEDEITNYAKSSYSHLNGLILESHKSVLKDYLAKRLGEMPIKKFSLFCSVFLERSVADPENKEKTLDCAHFNSKRAEEWQILLMKVCMAFYAIKNLETVKVSFPDQFEKQFLDQFLNCPLAYLKKLVIRNFPNNHPDFLNQLLNKFSKDKVWIRQSLALYEKCRNLKEEGQSDFEEESLTLLRSSGISSESEEDSRSGSESGTESTKSCSSSSSNNRSALSENESEAEDESLQSSGASSESEEDSRSGSESDFEKASARSFQSQSRSGSNQSSAASGNESDSEEESLCSFSSDSEGISIQDDYPFENIKISEDGSTVVVFLRDGKIVFEFIKGQVLSL